MRVSLKETSRGVSTRGKPTEVCKSTFNRIKSLDLQWHPCKMQERQELLADNLPNAMRNGLLKGDVNSQNVREYARNYLHLTLNGGISVECSLSGQHFGVMAWFWDFTFLTKMWIASYIFEC